MFKKVLIPLDLSGTAMTILDSMPGFKKIGTREIVILNVIDKRNSKNMQLSMINTGNKTLNEKTKFLQDQGFKVKPLIETGTPQLKILGVAEEEKVDAILMTAQGQSFLSRIFLGSVTDYVIHRAKMPVLIYKNPKDDATLGEKLFSKILHPTDFSISAQSAFEYLKNMDREQCNQIIVLHVQDTRLLDPHLMHKLQDFNDIDQRRLDKIKDKLVNEGFENVKTKLDLGVSISKIIEAAKDEDATLIIMGTKGKSNVAEMIMGSVAENVAQKSEIPVLLIPLEKNRK